MPTVKTQKLVNVSPESLWEVIGDFGNIAKFHPLIAESTHLGGEIDASGGERSCTFNDGGLIKERLLEYREGEMYTVEIFEFGKFPLKEAVVSIGLKPGDNSDSSVMYMNNNFKPKFNGPLGWLMGKMMAGKFNQIQNEMIEAAEYYVINGKKKMA